MEEIRKKRHFGEGLIKDLTGSDEEEKEDY
jgi:hypothetical protein